MSEFRVDSLPTIQHIPLSSSSPFSKSMNLCLLLSPFLNKRTYHHRIAVCNLLFNCDVDEVISFRISKVDVTSSDKGL